MKDRVVQTLKKRYPDKAFETDEEIESAYGEFENEYESTKNGYNELMGGSKKLAEAIRMDPTIGEVLTAIMSGTPFVVAVVEALGPDALKAEMDGEAIETAKTAYAEKAKSRETRMGELEANGIESSKVLSAFLKKTFKGDKERETEFVDWVSTSLQNVLDNKITQEIISKLYQGFIYTEAIEEAKQEGAIAANAKKITETRTEAPRQGLGSSAPANTEMKKPQSMGNKPFRI